MTDKVIALTLQSYVLYLFFVLIGWLIERRVKPPVQQPELQPERQPGRQPERQPMTTMRFNLGCALLLSLTQAVTLTVAPLVTGAAVNAVGGGWLVLPSSGWALLPAFLLYALTMDFFEYLFHRAQHRFPVLWAMHSLHHSDTALNVSTTSRHYWAEFVIKTMTIYLLAGMIFKINAAIMGLYLLLSLWNYLAHMNVRLGFGRWWMVLNSPQYHRIHHSSLRENWDCNFCALFPIFDVIFGTFHVPGPDEYPPTGLATGEHPAGWAGAILWPLRSLWRNGEIGGGAEAR
jgi:sterol desaturase/sphingolipid hydroxylase (fatty acid hydroxylase superfamily)